MDSRVAGMGVGGAGAGRGRSWLRPRLQLLKSAWLCFPSLAAHFHTVLLGLHVIVAIVFFIVERGQAANLCTVTWLRAGWLETGAGMRSRLGRDACLLELILSKRLVFEFVNQIPRSRFCDRPTRISAQAPRFFVVYDSQCPLSSLRVQQRKDTQTRSL